MGYLKAGAGVFLCFAFLARTCLAFHCNYAAHKSRCFIQLKYRVLYYDRIPW